MANVIVPGRKKEQQLVDECVLAWKSAQLSCTRFAAASTPETAKLAEYLLDSYKSFADDAVDGLCGKWPVQRKTWRHRKTVLNVDADSARPRLPAAGR